MNIYVSNLNWDATETDLEEHFRGYGPVASATINLHQNGHHKGKSDGTGIVVMEDQEDGERAIAALDGQEMMGRRLKVNKARPRGDHEERGSERRDRNDDEHDYFHNPYTFVPTPPRPSDGFAGDFNPLEHPLGEEHNLCHSSLKDHLWTGHIPIKLTTVTPLVLLKGDGEERSTDKHQTYDVLDYLPETSLRGMLRSAYEVVTNSRYSCFGNEHKERLAYRMDSRDAPELIPAIIKNGNKPGQLVAQLCTGTSIPTPVGPKRNGSNQERAMYAAMFDPYEHTELYTEYDSKYTPKTGHEVWAQIVLCQHEYKNYRYWKALKVWWTDLYPEKPIESELVKIPESSLYTDIDNPIERVVKGHVFITNENIKDKHDERIFFYDNPKLKLSDKDVTHLKADWEKLIKNYRDARSEKELFERQNAKNQPWKWMGNDPGKTAWSPHLYQDSKHQSIWHNNDPHGRATDHDTIELKHGDLVYARCEFKNGKISEITHLVPVSISRMLYDLSPRDLLPCSLRPAKRRSELSPADRLFGWVAQPDGEDSDQDNQAKAQDQEGDPYKGRIRVICDNGPRPNIIKRFEDDQTLPLTILGQPKPEQSRFYVAKDDIGTPEKDNIRKKDADYGYSEGKGLRGRKQYWHHKGLEAEPDEKKQKHCYWQPSVEDRTQIKRKDRYQEYRRPDRCPDKNNPSGWQQKDPQNRSITGWIKPGTKFKASLYVQNLQDKEIGALLWLLSLSEGHYFRLGYGKPLGFGSMRIEIDCPDEPLPLGTVPLGTGENWKEYYTVFDSSAPETLNMNKEQQDNCLQKFQESMVKAYSEVSDNDTTEENGDESKTSNLTSFDQLASVQSRFVNTPEGLEQSFENLSFIKAFLQILKGPETDLPIHYPRTNQKQDPEGKNFEWFRDNESRGKLALPAATEDKGIPYEP